MATDEVTKPSSLPSYSEMILGAIEALDEKSGSNKSSIAKHMESKYGDQLPEAHSSLLTAHLARMKESGEILMVKNNYMKPGPDVPPKRGRGRPPKPKPMLPPGAEPPSPRPRGRPPKKARVEGEEPAKEAEGAEEKVKAPAAPAPAGVKRGRGRPRKN